MSVRLMSPSFRKRQRGFIINPYLTSNIGSDPYWANVILLCHFDSSSGSPITYVNEVTANNDPRNSGAGGLGPDVSSVQSKYGGVSLLFAASSNNRCLTSTLVAPGTADHTVEFYTRLAAVNDLYVLCDLRLAGVETLGYAIYLDGVTSAGKLVFYINGVNVIESSGGALVADTWHHIAYSRESGNGRLFIDGTQVGSTYADSNNYTRTSWNIGTNFNGIQVAINSYFDEWRITNGTGRYTTNFTPPVAAFPNF